MTVQKNYASQWWATVYVAGISLAITFLLGRLFGPGTFGTYSYIVTVGALLGILQDGGFKTLINREQASPSLDLSPEQLLARGLGHLLITTSLAAVVILLLSLEHQKALLLALFSFGLGAATNFISSIKKGRGQFVEEAWWRFRIRTITAVAVVLSVWLWEPTVEGVLIAWSVGQLLVLISQREFSLTRISVFGKDNQVFKSVLALLIIDIATLIYFKIDIVMLMHLQDSKEVVGFYSASSRIIEGVILLLFPFANVFFRDFRLAWQEHGEFKKLSRVWLMRAAVCASVVVPMAWLLAEPVLTLCFGESFTQGEQILRFLLLALFFIIPNLVLTQGVLALNREVFYAKIACLAAVLNIGLNWALIPRLGPEGAALGTGITEAFLFGVFSWNMMRWLKTQHGESHG